MKSSTPALLVFSLALAACGPQDDSDPAEATASSEAALTATPPVLAAPVITSPAANSRPKGPDVVLQGTAAAGAKVTVTTPDGKPMCVVTADASGHWACAVKLEPGPHQVVATASLQGRTSKASSPVSFTVVEDEVQYGGGCGVTDQSPLLLGLMSYVLVAWYRRKRGT